MKNVALSGLVLGVLTLLVACGRREPGALVEAQTDITPASADAVETSSIPAAATPAANIRAVLTSSTNVRSNLPDPPPDLAEPRVEAPPDPPPEPGVRTYTEEEDFDGDGIADARTIRHFKYDAAGRPCRIVIERDFDADGKVDSRKTKLSSYDATGACGS